MPLFLSMLRSETAADPARRARALAGLAAYQRAQRPPPPPPLRVAHRHDRARLLDAGGRGLPVVLIPSLINPPGILDLGDRSLVRWLATQGFRPLLVDWGVPDPAADAIDVAGHVERLLLPLIAALDRPPVLVGYCLGGTMAWGAAAATAVAGVATIAAPWRFAGYGEAPRAAIAARWAEAEPACRAFGLVPMEVLQTGFWALDPRRTIAKYERFGELDPNDEAARAFVRLEDWANAGAPLPYAAGAELFDGFYRDDATARGAWRVAGRAVDPLVLPCPAVEFVSTTDRIVPAAAAAGLADRRALTQGHVGMVVGGRGRALLWEPLARWIAALPAAT